MSEQRDSRNDPENVQKMPPRKVRWGRIGCITLLFVVISAPFVIGYLFFASIVEGEEFSSDTFESRRFRYFRNPVTGTPLTLRAIEDSSSVLQQTLLSDGYVQPPATKTARWDLIRENWQSGTSPDFDVAILDSYLKMSTDGHDNYWSNWNEKHPEQAVVFWQLIAQLARANQYVLMPDLFQLAINAAEAKVGVEESFEEKLHELAHKLLTGQANRCRESGDSAMAIRLEQLSSSIVLPLQPAGKNTEESSGESTDR